MLGGRVFSSGHVTTQLCHLFQNGAFSLSTRKHKRNVARFLHSGTCLQKKPFQGTKNTVASGRKAKTIKKQKCVAVWTGPQTERKTRRNRRISVAAEV